MSTALLSALLLTPPCSVPLALITAGTVQP
jgi:hypothetical protein